MMRACVCVCVCVCLIIFHMCDTTCSVYDVLKKRVLSMMCLKNKQVPCVICLRKRFCPFLLPQRNDCNTLQHAATHRTTPLYFAFPSFFAFSFSATRTRASKQPSELLCKNAKKERESKTGQCVAMCCSPNSLFACFLMLFPSLALSRFLGWLRSVGSIKL